MKFIAEIDLDRINTHADLLSVLRLMGAKGGLTWPIERVGNCGDIIAEDRQVVGTWKVLGEPLEEGR